LVPMGKFEVTQKSSDDPAIEQFDSVPELENIGFVLAAITQPNFYRLSTFKLGLIAEYAGQPEVVLGSIRNLQGLPWDISELGLPEWRPPPPSH